MGLMMCPNDKTLEAHDTRRTLAKQQKADERRQFLSRAAYPAPLFRESIKMKKQFQPLINN